MSFIRDENPAGRKTTGFKSNLLSSLLKVYTTCKVHLVLSRKFLFNEYGTLETLVLRYPGDLKIITI